LGLEADFFVGCPALHLPVLVAVGHRWSAEHVGLGLGGPSGGGDVPASTDVAQAEAGHAGVVDCSGDLVPVGIDLGAASSPGVASGPQHVRELAFDLGAGRAVVGTPVGVLLSGTGRGQQPLVT
jgi:hypothetical protein